MHTAVALIWLGRRYGMKINENADHCCCLLHKYMSKYK